MLQIEPMRNFSLSPFQSPPNFLHAASLAKHVKPVVVMADEDEPEQPDDDDDEPEPLIEVSDVSTSSIQAQPQVRHIRHACTHTIFIDSLTQYHDTV